MSDMTVCGKVIGICEGYVEDKWVIWSLMLFLSVNIKPSSMYLQKIKRPVVSLFEKNVSSQSSKTNLPTVVAAHRNPFSLLENVLSRKKKVTVVNKIVKVGKFSNLQLVMMAWMVSGYEMLV